MEKNSITSCVIILCISDVSTRDAAIPVLIRLQKLTATLECTVLVAGCNDGIILIYLTLQLLYLHCISLHHNTAISVLQQNSATNSNSCFNIQHFPM